MKMQGTFLKSSQTYKLRCGKTPLVKNYLLRKRGNKGKGGRLDLTVG